MIIVLAVVAFLLFFIAPIALVLYAERRGWIDTSSSAMDEAMRDSDLDLNPWAKHPHRVTWKALLEKAEKEKK